LHFPFTERLRYNSIGHFPPTWFNFLLDKLNFTFTHIPVNAAFLNILFDHRQKFSSIGARSYPHNKLSSATIISWVDVVLAKLGNFILSVASGLSHGLHNHTSGYLQYQRDEDGIRAATQLPGISIFTYQAYLRLTRFPEKWESLMGVVASNQASPAAKRLALRLLFAAYVMCPRFIEKGSQINLGCVQGSSMRRNTNSLIPLEFNLGKS
jgi:hypothetical protein